VPQKAVDSTNVGVEAWRKFVACNVLIVCMSVGTLWKSGPVRNRFIKSVGVEGELRMLHSYLNFVKRNKSENYSNAISTILN
jgi:hypothetical protein